MSAATPLTPTVPTAVRPTWGRPLAAEWVKARSLRSVPWTLAVTAVVSLGFNVLAVTVSSARWDEVGGEGFDLVGVMLQPGAAIGQLGVAVLAVLLVTGEYGGATIAPTLLAVPRRTPVLAAKALLVGAAALVVGEVVGWLSYGYGALVFHDRLDVSLGHDQQWRIVLGFGPVLAVTALFALGVGAIVRHTAAGIAVTLGLMLVVPSVVAALPGRAAEWVSTLVPGGLAFHSLLLSPGDDGVVSPWVGFAVALGWAVVALGLATAALVRRDA